MKTTIKISKETNRLLNQLKYKYGYSSIEQVIIHYLNNKGGLENGKTNKLANVEVKESNS